MKRWYKVLLLTVLLVCGGTVGFSGWLCGYLPNSFSVPAGSTLSLAQTPYVTAEKTAESDGASRTVGANANTGSYSVQLRLFGVLPLKTVWVQQVQPRTVMASGAPFGIKLFSDGVMVVGFSDIYTETGYQNPAKSAGLRMGDTIHSINGVEVGTNEDIQAQMESSGGRPLSVTFSRKGEQETVFLTPVLDAGADVYRAGMRVRDSSAGIGTLTYFDTTQNVFAGLGHAVTDVDTGENIEVLSGQIVSVQVTGVAPSSAGSPGELKGVLSSVTAGEILENDTAGIFGRLRDGAEESFSGKAYQTAACQEVAVGEAILYTCIDGSVPKPYSVTIERINYSQANPNKNMIVRITDKSLLEQTGGIVQGMSGSPIIQNGKLVGAVTHVLVNDPTRGYGIFIENMLDAAA